MSALDGSKPESTVTFHADHIEMTSASSTTSSYPIKNMQLLDQPDANGHVILIVVDGPNGTFNYAGTDDNGSKTLHFSSGDAWNPGTYSGGSSLQPAQWVDGAN